MGEKLLNQLVVLAPAMVLVAYFVLAFALFSALNLFGRRPVNRERRNHSAFFHYFIDYFVWLIRPIERAFRNLHLSPNHLTIAALVTCASAGLAIGTGHLATAGWLYIAAGGFDVLDGRIARATGVQSRAGAFLDSVTDRWGELLVFSGCAWFLRDSGWLMAVMAAIAGSVMVSYTRARAEALGVALSGGIMQRPERITLVSIGILITAWFDSAQETVEYGPHVIGVCLLMVGLGSVATAVSRFWQGYSRLSEAGDTSSTADGERKLGSQA